MHSPLPRLLQDACMLESLLKQYFIAGDQNVAQWHEYLEGKNESKDFSK